jgi:hypothetical protein
MILIMSPVYAQVSANVTLDKQTVTTSSYVVMKIEVNGATRISNPRLEGMENFQIISSSSSQQFGFYNGRMERRTTFTYILNPQKTGILEVGKSTIEADSQTLTTRAQTLNVVGSYSQYQPGSNYQHQQNQYYSQQQQQHKPKATGQEVIFEADVDNTNPYQNQQIIYTIRVYLKSQLDQPNLEQPEFKDFIVEPLQDQTQYNTYINNINYAVIERSYALFPTKVGKITIEPAYLTGNLIIADDPFDTLFGSYDTQPVNVRTSPVTIYVKELPPPPPNFKNSVGEFKIATEVDKTHIKVGETAKLEIVVWGSGNIMSIHQPEFHLTEAFRKAFKVYESTPIIDINNKANYVTGQKIFKFDFVALKPGLYVIPAAELAYFKPENKMYHQLKSDVIQIKVDPGSTTEQLDVTTIENPSEDDQISVMDDIIDIHTPEKPIENKVVTVDKFAILALSFISPLLIYLCVLFYMKKQEYYKENIHEVKKSKAYNKAKAELKTLEPLVKQKATKEFFHQLDRIIKTYVGEKLNLQAGSLTPKDVDYHLTSAGVRSRTVLFITEILKLCEMSQYSTIADPENKISIAFNDTKRIIKLLEKELKKCD